MKDYKGVSLVDGLPQWQGCPRQSFVGDRWGWFLSRVLLLVGCFGFFFWLMSKAIESGYWLWSWL